IFTENKSKKNKQTSSSSSSTEAWVGLEPFEIFYDPNQFYFYPTFHSSMQQSLDTFNLYHPMLMNWLMGRYDCEPRSLSQSKECVSQTAKPVIPSPHRAPSSEARGISSLKIDEDASAYFQEIIRTYNELQTQYTGLFN